MRSLAILLACVTTCLSCSQSAHDIVEQNGRGSEAANGDYNASADSLAILERRLVAAHAELEDEVDPHDMNVAAAAVVRRARAYWHDRSEACTDDRCRRAVLSEQINRIEYGFGRNERPVAGMPWATGHLGLTTFPSGEASGRISLYPLTSDQLVIVMVTAAMPRAQWICEMVAIGQLRPGPVVEMRSLDEAAKRFVFRPAGAGQWSIESNSTENRHCGAWGSIEGDYRIGDVDPAVPRAFENLAGQQLPDEMNRALEMLEREKGGQ